jgi:hypothetical protein
LLQDLQVSATGLPPYDFGGASSNVNVPSTSPALEKGFRHNGQMYGFSSSGNTRARAPGNTRSKAVVPALNHAAFDRSFASAFYFLLFVTIRLDCDTAPRPLPFAPGQLNLLMAEVLS